jgi:hypothetical protein
MDGENTCSSSAWSNRANGIKMRNERETRPPSRHRVSQPAYVLFASMFARDFYAIVPTHGPIPRLLLSPAWRFVRILRGASARQGCLCRKPAVDAINKDGFYLFADRTFVSEIEKHARKLKLA